MFLLVELYEVKINEKTSNQEMKKVYVKLQVGNLPCLLLLIYQEDCWDEICGRWNSLNLLTLIPGSA